MGEYVVKEKNIKNIIAYILLSIVAIGYGYCMFHYMPIGGIIVSGITLVVVALYLIEDVVDISKKLMFSILGISYTGIPALYWIIVWVLKITEGKDPTDIFFGFFMGLLLIALLAMLIGLIVCAIKNSIGK
ncbi:MAG: hypothetical protein K2M17_04640 [Bacilli bacterium]|nr:hypothetical protein [Bacilli bacterium]